MPISTHKLTFLRSLTRNSPRSTLRIGYKEQCVQETVNTKSPGLQIVNRLYRNYRIEQIILKLSPACLHRYVDGSDQQH